LVPDAIPGFQWTDTFIVFWVRIQQTPLMGALFLLFYQRLDKGPQGA